MMVTALKQLADLLLEIAANRCLPTKEEPR
jgi:hypothetical protein